MANANGSVASVSWNATPLPALPLSGLNTVINAEVEDVTPYGVTDQVQAYTGLKKKADIKLTLLYDDTVTTGEDALFAGNIGATGTLLVTYKTGPKTSSTSAIVKSYERQVTVGKMTKAVVTFAPTGVWTEV